MLSLAGYHGPMINTDFLYCVVCGSIDTLKSAATSRRKVMSHHLCCRIL